MSSEIVVKYKTQLDLAGRDGLDDAACKFMTVGLEHMGNKVSVSNESFVNTTEALDSTLKEAIELTTA